MNHPRIPLFEVDVSPHASSTTVSISGDFDLTRVPDFESSVAALEPTPHVVIDVGGTTLIDSAALGAVLRTVRDRREGGERTSVRATKPFQRRLFEVTGLAYLLADAPSDDSSME